LPGFPDLLSHGMICMLSSGMLTPLARFPR
jgi:hypothetical protein